MHKHVINIENTWSLLGQDFVLTKSNLFFLNEHPVYHHHLC